MPRSSNQKPKLLYLSKILLERTDESHALTAQGLVDALAAYDIPVLAGNHAAVRRHILR